MSRVLIVVRHAKAESYGASDHERALTDRGLAQARDAGRWLADRGLVPDQAVVSDALRTRQTWRSMAETAGWAVTPWVDSSLYEGGVETALELVHALDEDTGTALLVGHNPTVAALVQALDEAGAPRLAQTGFPPGTVAVLAYDGAWAALGDARARLTDVQVPA